MPHIQLFTGDFYVYFSIGSTQTFNKVASHFNGVHHHGADSPHYDRVFIAGLNSEEPCSGCRGRCLKKHFPLQTSCLSK